MVRSPSAGVRSSLPPMRSHDIGDKDPFELSVLGQNPFDLGKVEGEDVGDLRGSEGAF